MGRGKGDNHFLDGKHAFRRAKPACRGNEDLAKDRRPDEMHDSDQHREDDEVGE
jgi:hypothetical protein